jgi:hypothetical protein
MYSPKAYTLQNIFMNPTAPENLSESICYHFIEITDSLERFKKIATHYSSLNNNERSKTPVLVSNSREKKEVSKFIRNNLKHQGLLETLEKSYFIYLPKHLSETEKSSILSYQREWYLRFNEDSPNCGIHKYDYWEICFIDKGKKNLKLLDGKGKATQWSPSEFADNKKSLRKIEIFTREERKIAAGEILQMQRANINKKLHSGALLTVIDIYNKGLKVENKEGKTIRFDCAQTQDFHFDYSYVTTPNCAQPIGFDTIIAHQDSQHANINQHQFYTILSQAKKDVWFYTDDKQALLAQLKKETFVQ